ncbi:O-antigen/teichoic acid export membrane protein [Nocardiopsis terrae]|uniref:O-antigen/teichoic acid export membrane protein n=1 Tax=Nocardiopsis terrae TaxID=372655 RepID=A0ABR9HBJ2_9ACTN|nr:lipopolysaccharide biosynthesis protein [Nocardiopsis terrae]MBE1456396.1 O-antigen/teichoic acid export membrane protein [Nocardiopsis terrae]
MTSTRAPSPAGPGGLRDRGLGRILRGGAVNMAGAVVGAALNLALIVAITRAFSQETAGLLFSATSVFLITAAVANAGAPDGLVYFIARLRVFGRPGGVPALLRLALGPAVLAACLVSVLLVVLARPLADALGPQEAAAYLRLLALFLPFAVLTDSVLAATRAHHDMSVTVLVDKVGRPLAQLGLVAMIALSGSAGFLALAWAGPYLPAAVLAWFWLGRIVRGAEAAPSPGDVSPAVEERSGPGDRQERVTPAEFWSFALPRALGGVAQAGVQRGGVVMVALLHGLTGAAVFTAATRIMVVGQFCTQAVLYTAQPRFAELLAAGEHGSVRALYQAGTSWLVCLNWPLYLSALMFAPEVMRLFGTGYSAGATALVVVCAGQLAASVLGMGDLVLTMTGRTGLNLLNNVMSLLASVVAGVLLVPSHGAAGAAGALVVAVLVRKLLPLWQLRSLVVLHPFSRPVLVATGSALLWFGALPVLLEAVAGPGVPTLIAGVLAGAAGHLCTVWLARGHLEPRR